MSRRYVRVYKANMHPDNELKEIGMRLVQQFEDGLLGDEAKPTVLEWVHPWLAEEQLNDKAWTKIFDDVEWGGFSEEKPNDGEKDRAYSLTNMRELMHAYGTMKGALRKYPELKALLPELDEEGYFPFMPIRLMEQLAKATYDIWLHVRNDEIPRLTGEPCQLTMMGDNYSALIDMAVNDIAVSELQLIVIAAVEIVVDLDMLFLDYKSLYSLPGLLERLDDKLFIVPTDYLREVADILYNGNESIPRCHQLAARLYAHDADNQLSRDRLKKLSE